MNNSLSILVELTNAVGVIAHDATAVIVAVTYLVQRWMFPAQPLKRRNKDIESLQFIQEQLAFPLRRRHRLPIEQAFSIYFKRPIRYDVAVAILQLQNPLTAFKLFFSGRDYLEYNNNFNSFDFKSKFKKQKARQFRKWHFIAWYFIFALSGMYLLIYSADILSMVGFTVLPGLVVLISCSLSLAYIFIDGSLSVVAAERFIEESKYLVLDS